MKFKRLYPDSTPVKTPKDGDIAYDIPCYGNYTLVPGQITEISTGLAFEIPEGYGGIILGRSGLAFNQYLECWHNGAIDNNFRGELKVLVKNHGYKDIELNHGDRIVQMLITSIYTNSVEEVEELSKTNRGDKGFGSSGLSSDVTNTYYIVFDGGNGGATSGLGYGSYMIRKSDRHGDIFIDNQLDYSEHGTMTNNDAEYFTLYKALYHLKLKLIENKCDLKDITLIIEGDSELVRKQIGTRSPSGVWNGWKCNMLRLKSYRDEIRTLLIEFNSFTYNHVPREYIVSVLGH